MSHLPPYERTFVEFMQSDQNTLGWRPNGRDENGYAQVITELPIPKHPERMRICRMTLTPKGHVHHHIQVIGGPDG